MAGEKKGLFGVLGDLLRKALGSSDPKPPQTPPRAEPQTRSSALPQTRGAPPIRDVDERVLMDSLIDNTKKNLNVDIPPESKPATAKRSRKQRERDEKFARAREENRPRIAEIQEFERLERSRAAEAKAPVEAPQPIACASSPPPSAIHTKANDREDAGRGEAPWFKTLHRPPPDVAGRPANDVRIGIDFGTSYSKMAIKMLDRTFMVEWSGLCATENPYLLPTEASQLKSGEVVARVIPGAALVRQGLKVPFLNDSATDDDYAWMAAYLANLLRYARAWIAFHHGRELATINPRWEVNLGLPAGSWAEKPALTALFKKVGQCAWVLSLNDFISIDGAADLLKNNANKHQTDHDATLEVVPEFVAQVAAYMESSQRREGVHLLADIGGGTLDFACFYVSDPRSEYQGNIPIYSADVSPNGTTNLMITRLNAVAEAKFKFSPAAPVPSAEALAQTLNVSVEQLRKVDNAVKRLISQLIKSVVSDGRYKNSNAPEFSATCNERNMRVFISGGGAKVEPYPSGVEVGFSNLGLRVILGKIPEIDKIVWRNEGERPAYDRMSVAAGLTLSLDMLRPIAPDGITRIMPLRTVERPDRDDLYPK